MHGPEAARVMREELNYRGAIIGRLCTSLYVLLTVANLRFQMYTYVHLISYFDLLSLVIFF